MSVGKVRRLPKSGAPDECVYSFTFIINKTGQLILDILKQTSCKLYQMSWIIIMASLGLFTVRYATSINVYKKAPRHSA